jgi:hypothetical protein
VTCATGANSGPHLFQGAPDLYLVTITDKILSGAESENRSEEYRAWRKKTVAQMQKESGDRAEFREVTTNFLLEEMKFRK